MLECVVNISEGQRPDVLEALARACGPVLLDVHTDVDHHRSVFTLASAEPSRTEAGTRRLAIAAADALSLAGHDGVHPRLGVIDVVPFVALDPTPPEVSIDAARSFAGWIGSELDVPGFLYDLADPDHRTLPSVRRDAFSARRPDFGPASPHRRLGATAVGARGLLVAVNLELEGDDAGIARAVAQRIRERDGGLPGVRALGLRLPSRANSQVSMNLVALDATGLETACVAAREQVDALGGRVRRLELVGLAPAAVLDACSAEFLEWSGLGPDHSIERRAAAVAGGSVTDDAVAGGPGASDGVATGATPDAGPDSPA